jgi:hypothetical protein
VQYDNKNTTHSYDDRSGSYVPHSKDAIKQRTQQALRNRAK